jgi:RNA polymerase sigma-70 factor (ECF subfamily)
MSIRREGLDDRKAEVGDSGEPLEQAQQAFITALFVRYRGTLLRYAERLVGSVEDAADLVQETYYRVMRRPMTSKLEAAARAYLLQTMRNLAKDVYRANSRRFARFHVMIDEDLPDAVQTPEELVTAQQAVSELLQAVHRLPTDQRVVLLLNRQQDMTLDDIAAQLGISKRTAERRLRTALESLLQTVRLET